MVKHITTASRSRDYMRGLGWLCENVEKRNGIFRNDLFGFADVICYHKDKGILLVQAYKKGRDKEHASLVPEKNKFIEVWLLAGGLFEHQVWSHMKKGGKRKFWSVFRINYQTPE
jgi:hypothetical protein